MDKLVKDFTKELILEFVPPVNDENVMKVLQQQHDLRELLISSRNEFIKLKFKAFLNTEYQLDQLGDVFKNIRKRTQENKEKLSLIQADKTSTRYFYLTISPKPSVDLSSFLKKVEGYIKRKMFVRGVAVIEQRGTSENKDVGHGFHAHFLVERNLNYKPSKININSENTFKSVCNIKSSAYFGVWCPSEYLPDKLEYMRTGGKTADGKAEKQDADVVFRRENNIPTYYTNNWEL